MVVKMRSGEAFTPENIYLICIVHGPPKIEKDEFSKTQILFEKRVLLKNVSLLYTFYREFAKFS